MNNVRRKEITRIINDLMSTRKDLRKVLSGEESAFDNLSDGLQATMRGGKMEEAIDCLSDAEEKIDELIDYLEWAKSV